MANKHPELQEKIILASLLAPVAYVGEMKSPIRLIAPFADSLEVCHQISYLLFYIF